MILFKKGFTVAEFILIIALITVVVAAIIPRALQINEEARVRVLNENLGQLREKINNFYFKSGTWPFLVTVDGDSSGVSVWNYFQTDSSKAVGVYKDNVLSGVPVNPLNNSFTVRDAKLTGTPFRTYQGDKDGWIYDFTTGQLIAGRYDEANQKDLGK